MGVAQEIPVFQIKPRLQVIKAAQKALYQGRRLARRTCKGLTTCSSTPFFDTFLFGKLLRSLCTGQLLVISKSQTRGARAHFSRENLNLDSIKCPWFIYDFMILEIRGSCSLHDVIWWYIQSVSDVEALGTPNICQRWWVILATTRSSWMTWEARQVEHIQRKQIRTRAMVRLMLGSAWEIFTCEMWTKVPSESSVVEKLTYKDMIHKNIITIFTPHPKGGLLPLTHFFERISHLFRNFWVTPTFCHP